MVMTHDADIWWCWAAVPVILSHTNADNNKASKYQFRIEHFFLWDTIFFYILQSFSSQAEPTVGYMRLSDNKYVVIEKVIFTYIS